MKNNKIPLHTNNTKKTIADKSQTNNIKKIVIMIFVPLSLIMSIKLFSSMGFNIFYKCLFGAGGAGTVILAILMLRKFKNTVKKSRYIYLAWYLFFTSISVIGSIGGGFASIQKSKLNNSENYSSIDLITKKINQIENKDYKIINRQINNLQIAKTKLNYNIAERTIDVDNKISQLRKELKISKEEFLVLKKLKHEKAEAEKTVSDIIDTTNGISILFGISILVVSMIILAIFALSVEVAIWFSADFKGSLFPRFKFPRMRKLAPKKTKPKRLSKFEKELKAGQLRLKNRMVG